MLLVPEQRLQQQPPRGCRPAALPANEGKDILDRYFGIRALDQQVKNDSSGLHQATGVIGTTVSGTFLYLIAALNLVVLISIIKVFREMRTGRYSDEELEKQLDSRGLMNRIFGGYARRIDTPWKMYPVGVLFGLGFDTATEVTLLVLAGPPRQPDVRRIPGAGLSLGALPRAPACQLATS